MDVRIDVNGLSDDFGEIISRIENAGDIQYELNDVVYNNYGEVSSLLVERYTVGTSFLDHVRDYTYFTDHKLVFAKAFLNRTDINFETLERKFREWGAQAFSRGESVIEAAYIHGFYKKNNFVVDCLFVIEVILRYTRSDGEDAVDGLSSVGILSKARRDLLVNNNQLPFFVLEALFAFAFPAYATSADRNFLKLCVVFFSKCMLITEYSQVSPIILQLQNQRTSGSQIKDFIDLLRKCHAPVFPRQPPTDPIKFIAMRKASYLDEAGMKIMASSIDTSVCSLRYSRGKLEIPKLKINNMSIHLLKNLMDYELQYHPQDTFLIDYLHFMDSLIDTAKDVDVLIHNEIIDNFLASSKEVAALFNSVAKGVLLVSHNYYYHGVSEAVNAYCQVPHHRWKATLRRDYCSSPWMVASTIAAIILLLLTFVQAVCSIVSAVK